MAIPTLITPSINTTGIQDTSVNDYQNNIFEVYSDRESLYIEQEGIAQGFDVQSGTDVDNEIDIVYEAGVTESKNGLVGAAAIKHEDGSFLICNLKSPTKVTLIIPQNTGVGSVYYLLCLKAKTDIASLDAFQIQLYQGDVGEDPDIDSLRNETFKIYPIARIIRLASSGGIIIQKVGQVTFATNEDVRKKIEYLDNLAGTTPIMTTTQRDAKTDWSPGAFVITTENNGDINNKLWVNLSQTTTALFKQVVLIAQATLRWYLLTEQDMGTGANATFGTYTLNENTGTPAGAFTLPSNFWSVGKRMTITRQNKLIANGPATNGTFVLHNHKLDCSLNGVIIGTSRITRNISAASASSWSENTITASITFECTQVNGNNVQLLVIENDVNTQKTPGVPTYTSTTYQRILTVNITQGTPQALSFVTTKSRDIVSTPAVSTGAVPTGFEITLNNMASFTISVEE